ncbi:uncharacterized protein [Hoplias malabaricus]|uniref:uncharacterized protein n=1 Tax=Hoplias malabaricus TaxID=27720 RepID=UPI003462CCFB
MIFLGHHLRVCVLGSVLVAAAGRSSGEGDWLLSSRDSVPQMELFGRSDFSQNVDSLMNKGLDLGGVYEEPKARGPSIQRNREKPAFNQISKPGPDETVEISRVDQNRGPLIFPSVGFRDVTVREINSGTDQRRLQKSSGFAPWRQSETRPLLQLSKISPFSNPIYSQIQASPQRPDPGTVWYRTRLSSAETEDVRRVFPNRQAFVFPLEEFRSKINPDKPKGPVQNGSDSPPSRLSEDGEAMLHLQSKETDSSAFKRPHFPQRNPVYSPQTAGAGGTEPGNVRYRTRPRPAPPAEISGADPNRRPLTFPLEGFSETTASGLFSPSRGSHTLRGGAEAVQRSSADRSDAPRMFTPTEMDSEGLKSSHLSKISRVYPQTDGFPHRRRTEDQPRVYNNVPGSGFSSRLSTKGYAHATLMSLKPPQSASTGHGPKSAPVQNRPLSTSERRKSRFRSWNSSLRHQQLLHGPFSFPQHTGASRSTGRSSSPSGIMHTDESNPVMFSSSQASRRVSGKFKPFQTEKPKVDAVRPGGHSTHRSDPVGRSETLQETFGQ